MDPLTPKEQTMLRDCLGVYYWKIVEKAYKNKEHRTEREKFRLEMIELGRKIGVLLTL